MYVPSGAAEFIVEKFFVERDWRYTTWQKERFGAFGTRNPVVGKYIIGASLFLAGKGQDSQSIPGYDPQHFNWDIVKDKRPPTDILAIARHSIMVNGVLSSVILFLLARELSQSWLVGLLTALLFMFSPLVLLLSREAMMDIPAIFFSLVTLGSAMQLYRNIRVENWTRAILWSIALGIGCGLALGVKLNTLLIPAICILWGAANLIWLSIERCSTNTTKQAKAESIKSQLICLFDKLHQDSKRIWFTALSITLFMAIAIATVWALNPFLYSHPIQNTKHMIELGQIVATYDVPENQRLDTWMESWKSLLSMGLKRYGIFYYWPNLFGVDAILAGLGGLLYIHASLRKESDWLLKRNFSLFLIWSVVIVMGVIYWTPFSWERWYLPVEPIWAFLKANGILLILLGIRQAYLYVSKTLLPLKNLANHNRSNKYSKT